MYQTEHHVTVVTTLASYPEGPRFDYYPEVLSGPSQFLTQNICMELQNVTRAYSEIISNQLFTTITQFDVILRTLFRKTHFQTANLCVAQQY
jgi:hypothetical protein